MYVKHISSDCGCSPRVVTCAIALDLRLVSQTLFARYGDILDAKVVRNHRDGRSLGYGFISYVDDDSAQAAIAAMNGFETRGERFREKACGVGATRFPAASLQKL